MAVRRIYVEKKPGFDVKARKLMEEITEYLKIKGIENVRIINRYDVEGISDEDYEKAKTLIFSEPPVDYVYEEELPLRDNERVFAVEYLPGQYDQRADSCAQCIQLLSGTERPEIRVATVIAIGGDISDKDFEKIKEYYINPIESREAALTKPETLREEYAVPDMVDVIKVLPLWMKKPWKNLLPNWDLQCPLKILSSAGSILKIPKREIPPLPN